MNDELKKILLDALKAVDQEAEYFDKGFLIMRDETADKVFKAIRAAEPNYVTPL